MIIVRLRGGLGNQLFQYARGLLAAGGGRVFLDLADLAADPQRSYALDALAVSARPLAPIIAQASRRLWFEAGMHPRYGCPPRVLAQRGLPVHECDARYRLGPCTWLVGYWQSPRGLAAIRPRLLRELRLRRQPGSDRRVLLARPQPVDLVAVHARFGDYHADPAVGAVHGTLPPSWYESAAAQLERQRPRRYRIFSDDPDLAERLILPGRPRELIRGGSAAEDLLAMAACPAHIVANSSFSWWGAWLSAAPPHEIVAPRPWFRAPRPWMRDPVPGSWSRL